MLSIFCEATKLTPAPALQSFVEDQGAQIWNDSSLKVKKGNRSERKGHDEMHDDSNDNTERGNIPGYA